MGVCKTSSPFFNLSQVDRGQIVTKRLLLDIGRSVHRNLRTWKEQRLIKFFSMSKCLHKNLFKERSNGVSNGVPVDIAAEKTIVLILQPPVLEHMIPECCSICLNKAIGVSIAAPPSFSALYYVKDDQKTRFKYFSAHSECQIV